MLDVSNLANLNFEILCNLYHVYVFYLAMLNTSVVELVRD